MTWTVRDKARDDKEWEVESRSEAEEKKSTAVELGANPEQIEIVPPQEDIEPEVVDQTEEKAADGGATVEEPTPEELENDPEIITGVDDLEQDESAGYDLPDKPPVDEDPIAWMPQDFTDNIEGKTAINRKGYEVMARHYGIGTPDSDCKVGPEETDYTFCRVKATAETDDGTVYTAHGSAHVDRGDDPFLLLEMADTRARKRVLAQATGVGMVAVEELMNGVSGQ